ncbi:MAG: hypothetical protein K2Y18_07680 [Alphaproteobacteria bacterium]|jgi:hypothetical protein|nr:hypothetical protein [Alphaproteobacteria bacterium]
MNKYFIHLSSLVLALTTVISVSNAAENINQSIDGRPYGDYGGTEGNWTFERKSLVLIDARARVIMMKRKNPKTSTIPALMDWHQSSILFLAQQRQEIARVTATPSWEKFGQVRDDLAFSVPSTTNGWRDFAIFRCQEMLRQNIARFISPDDLEISTPDADTFCKINVYNLRGLLNVQASVLKTLEEQLLMDKVQKLFTSCPTTEITERLQGLMGEDNALKVVTFSFMMKTEEGPVCITQIITWVERDPETQSGFSPTVIDKMGETSAIYILHTAPKLIPLLMAKADRSAAEAILTDPKATELLTQKIGNYVYWMTHPMKFNRGTASIMEMFAKGICVSDDLVYTYNGRADMDAYLFYDPAEFVNHFKKRAVLKAKE